MERSEEQYRKLINDFKQSKPHLSQGAPFYQNKEYDTGDIYKDICILGGGTAGYLTALALKKLFNIPVTLIESSKIPPIGVGEATTPIIKGYLFDVLGLNVAEFYEKVKPTWKLGIKFEWGLPGEYFFNYPFDGKDVLSAIIHNNDINYCSLNSLMMSKDVGFISRVPNGEETKHHSLSKSLKYAYHLDNKSLIRYLKEKAIEFGVNYIDDEIIDAVTTNDGEEISYLVNKDYKKYEFDFFVDCTGFKSLLLDKKLKSKYVSYSSSLFNDTAVVSTVPHNGKIKPYTGAITMNNGWCWNIPLRHEDHIGYVHCSEFCSLDEAHDEMKKKFPTMNKDVKQVKFRTGRHEEFIKGNVVAIGNSYAFIEPLESTGLHMIIDQIIVLTNSFFNLKSNKRFRKELNSNMNAHWDYLRWFLSIHFKFNKKLDTKYWKASREKINSSGFDPLVELYQEIGFLSRQDIPTTQLIRSRIKDTIFDVYGVDHLLLGLGLRPKNLSKIKLNNKKEWQGIVENWENILKYSIPLQENVDLLVKHPTLVM
ncbi:tryptophan halogenase family protein [Aquimarina gracilis]|uniref:Tryptophan halogenase family protein n=1 Tax=Aquimarina gracilis TaxID=874422 RepID=A0ABU5ZU84_9FLAO|nr:tryptophan halogenase family protein [Aquimarina gracilis]MEB3345642.1 tryptophan halogenase family protein [Aquimarina gracilis]